MGDDATIKESFNVAPAQVSGEDKRRKRDTEMGRLRGQVRRERTLAKMAKRHAMDCDARQAEAEAGQAQAEARHAKLKARHLKVVAEHEHALDAAIERAETAEAVAATCTRYDGNPANYEGAHADCPVHGAIRAFNEERAENERLQAELNRIVAEIEAERDKVREAEGASARDEHVINGIVNGLGIALRIVRGEP